MAKAFICKVFKFWFVLLPEFLVYWLWRSWRYRKLRTIIMVVYNPKYPELLETIKEENRLNPVRNKIIDSPDESLQSDEVYLFLVPKSQYRLEKERAKLLKKQESGVRIQESEEIEST